MNADETRTPIAADKGNEKCRAVAAPSIIAKNSYQSHLSAAIGVASAIIGVSKDLDSHHSLTPNFFPIH
jgi:hypothetical protein